MTEHTPTPWTVMEGIKEPLWIDAHGSARSICAMDVGGPNDLPQAKVDAVFVVLAVNNHKALVEALTEANDVLEMTVLNDGIGEYDPSEDQSALNDVRKRISAILSQVKT